MPEYLARYTIEFHLTNTQNILTNRSEYEFKAETEKEAKQLAEEHKDDLQGNNIHVTLDKLFRKINLFKVIFYYFSCITHKHWAV